MRIVRRRAITFPSVLLLMAAAACGRKQVVETPEPTSEPSRPTAIPMTTSAPMTSAATPSTVDRSEQLTSARRVALEERIYFDFNQFDLSPAAMTTLRNKADVLRSAPGVMLSIAGHADERGSDEYNLALSNRRAAEAKRFLVQQGLDANRFETVGYGEEQPADASHNEQAWGLNRRAEFQIRGGDR